MSRTAILLVIAVSLVVSLSCLPGAGRETAAEPVVMPARVTELIVTVDGTGPLLPGNRTTVRADVGGTISSVSVAPGDHVSPGDSLARLTSEDLKLREQEAVIDLQLAEHRVRHALGLGPTDPIPTDTQSGTRVTAPRDGHVLSLDVTAGDQIRAGQALAVIVCSDWLEFKVNMTETEANSLNPGDQVNIALDQFAGFVAGTLHSIDDQPVPIGGSFWHRATFLVPAGGLLSAGQEGTANFDSFTRRGELDWHEPTTVTASVAATVSAVSVREGQRVDRGAEILRYDDRALAPELRSLVLAADRARVQLDRVRADISTLEVSAPSSGVVTTVLVEPGDTVRPGDELFTIVGIDEFKVKINVDELELPGLAVGMPAVVRVDAYPDAEFPGHVSDIAFEGTVQDAVSSFAVTIVIPDPGPDLRPGLMASVNIELERRDGVLVIPPEAVSYEGPDAYVQVLTADGIQSRPVTLGTVTPRAIEVTSGLEPGDQVVVARPASSSVPGVMTRPDGR